MPDADRDHPTQGPIFGPPITITLIAAAEKKFETGRQLPSPYLASFFIAHQKQSLW